MGNDSDKEQAPPKPKVLFQMNFQIWDDGEITRDLVEKVQGERGAPKAWRLEPRDFATSVKATIGEKTKIFEALLKALDITPEEMKKTYQLDKSTQNKVDKIASAFSSTSSSSKKTEDTDGEDINFEDEGK